MDDLKLVAKAVGLDEGAKVDDVVAAIRKVSEERDYWKTEAHDNLSKMETTEKLLVDAVEARADAFINSAVEKFKITKAEAPRYKAHFMSGEQGEAFVRDIIGMKSAQDYLMRKSALDHVEPPSDPLTELDQKATKVMEEKKISKVAARSLVLDSDEDLRVRYNARYVKGATAGGDR